MKFSLTRVIAATQRQMHQPCTRPARVRMETPVVYFYSDREMTVSVKVGFPKGRVTEWYPRANNVHDGIDWGRIRILPDLPASFPTEKEPSRYYTARETDASPIRVCSEAGSEMEKFLFYRGVGRFAVPLSARVSGDGKVVVENRGSGRIPSVILFENRGGRLGYRNAGAMDDAVTLDRPSLDGSLPALRRDLEAANLDPLSSSAV